MTDTELISQINERLELVDAIFLELREHLQAARRFNKVLCKRIDARTNARDRGAGGKKMQKTQNSIQPATSA